MVNNKAIGQARPQNVLHSANYTVHKYDSKTPHSLLVVIPQVAVLLDELLPTLFSATTVKL